jgi:hypothetical protein
LALDAPDMRETTRALRTWGIAEHDAAAMIEGVGRLAGTEERIVNLRTLIVGDDAQDPSVERCMLLHAVMRNRNRITALRMCDGVMRHFADELRFLADPPEGDHTLLLAPSSHFVATAKVVTLRRFPAGQVHFEVAGIPLSWLVRLGPWRLTKALTFLARHVGALRPFFSHHLTARRKNRFFLLESEQNRSYYRIAQSLALYPDVKGLVTESWLHSPDTFRVSPHLSWLNKTFQEHGGLILILGKASESSGVFTASIERKRLYDEGRFQPTTAMALWPRRAMLDWANNHPEFAD